MVIIGVDPGLNITGYGVLSSAGHNVKILEAGIIKSGDRDSFERRLEEIYNETGKVFRQFKPDYVAIEELYSHYAHPKTAIIMGHARGMVFLQAARCKVPIISYASTKIKNSLTGNGRASKNQMIRSIKSMLHLENNFKSPDTADALAVALCHHNTLMGERK